jgi:hypothetical protein
MNEAFACEYKVGFLHFPKNGTANGVWALRGNADSLVLPLFAYNRSKMSIQIQLKISKTRGWIEHIPLLLRFRMDTAVPVRSSKSDRKGNITNLDFSRLLVKPFFTSVPPRFD